jgi:thioredoxin-dependent peroxiredoxin
LQADVIAINPASAASHESYCEKKGFSFSILSDPERKVARAYEALKLGGLLIQRTVYVVGPDGKIVFAEQGMPADQNMLDAIKRLSK